MPKKGQAVFPPVPEGREGLPELGGCYIVLGPPRTGKSSFILNMVEAYRDDLTTLFVLSPNVESDMSFEGVKRMAEAQHPDDPEVILRTQFDEKELHEYGQFIRDYPPAEGHHHMVVLDDVIGQLPNTSSVWSILSRWRHLGLTVILGSQKLRQAVPKTARTLASCWMVLGVGEPERKEVDEELAPLPATRLLDDAKKRLGHYASIRWMPGYGIAWANSGDLNDTTREALVYEKNAGDYDDWLAEITRRKKKKVRTAPAAPGSGSEHA